MNAYVSHSFTYVNYQTCTGYLYRAQGPEERYIGVYPYTGICINGTFIGFIVVLSGPIDLLYSIRGVLLVWYRVYRSDINETLIMGVILTVYIKQG